MHNGEWLDSQQFDPVRYAIDGLIPQGLTLNAGAPKIGKSWLVADCALAAAAGGTALGSVRVAQRPVLYLALEDGHERLQTRTRMLLAGGPLPRGFEFLTEVRHGLVLRTIQRWLIGHEGDEGLVILDTLGRVMPPALKGETTYDRDYRIGSELKGLADAYGGFVLVNHHDRKAAADDFVEMVSGTNGLAGSADTIMVLRRNRHEDRGVIAVTGRDVEEAEYALTFRWDQAWRLDGNDLKEAAANASFVRSTAGLGDRSTQIVDFVSGFPDGVHAADVAQQLRIKVGETRQYLSRLALAGRIVRVERGLYAPCD